MAIQAGACFFGVFGILATVAIITTVIIIRKSKQKKLAYKSDDSDNSVRHNGFEYRYDPETKTIVESGAPVSNDSNNNLRKRSSSAVSTTDKKSDKSSDEKSEKSVPNNDLRKCSPSAVSTTDNKSEKSSDEKSEKSINTKNNSKVTKEVQTDPIDINQNIDHNKILPDKVLMPMSAEEKVINYLNLDTPASNSDSLGNPDPVNNFETLSSASSSNWSNLSSEKSTDNAKKAYKKRIHNSLQKVTDIIKKKCEFLAARSDDNSVSDTASESDNSSTSSSWSDISSVKSTDDFEKAYKKTMRKTLKQLAKDVGKTSRASSECSDESEFSIISEETEKCFTCEKNRVNTTMQPCMHRYLCSDCAPMIFRVQNKCKVCRAKIERILVED